MIVSTIRVPPQGSSNGGVLIVVRNGNADDSGEGPAGLR
jgi:hypothetical protein